MIHKNKINELFDKYDFVLVKFNNGHHHTLKAYGVPNIDPISLEDNFEANFTYLMYVKSRENTSIFEVSFSNSEKEAIRKGILDEDLGFK